MGIFRQYSLATEAMKIIESGKTPVLYATPSRREPILEASGNYPVFKGQLFRVKTATQTAANRGEENLLLTDLINELSRNTGHLVALNTAAAIFGIMSWANYRHYQDLRHQAQTVQDNHRLIETFRKRAFENCESALGKNNPLPEIQKISERQTCFDTTTALLVKEHKQYLLTASRHVFEENFEMTSLVVGLTLGAVILKIRQRAEIRNIAQAVKIIQKTSAERTYDPN